MAKRFIRSVGVSGGNSQRLMPGVFISSSFSRSFPVHVSQRCHGRLSFSPELMRTSGQIQPCFSSLRYVSSRSLSRGKSLCSRHGNIAARDGASRHSIITSQTRCFAEKQPQRPKDEKDGVTETETDETNQSTSHKPLAKSLSATRERTKVVGERVRSALPGLTPHENIWNIPNLLTVSRLVAAPVTAYFLLHDQYLWAVASFAYAGITDLVDGWMARRFKLQTVAGSVMDPMADKALMIIVTVTLAVKGALPLYLATLILGRDASLAVAAIYYRYASLPSPKTFMRYWDFSLPSAEVHPTTVSKYNTFLQLLLIGSTLALPVITGAGQYSGLLETTVGLSNQALHTFMTAFQILVAGTTAWSGLSYAFLKDAVTILGKDENLKAKQGARGRAIIGVTFGGVVATAAWFAYQELEHLTETDEAKAAQEKPGASVPDLSK